jgi:hypothetical protein
MLSFLSCSPNIKWLVICSSLVVASGWTAIAFLSGATYGTGALILSSMISGGIISALTRLMNPFRKPDESEKIQKIIHLYKELQKAFERYCQVFEQYKAKMEAELAQSQELVRKLSWVHSAASYVIRDAKVGVRQDKNSRVFKIGKAAIENLDHRLSLITQDEAWVVYGRQS